MNKSDYDKYYKKGGTYVIPVEIFNELFDELERLQKLLDIEKNKRGQFDKNNQKLHSIIKEVREYVDKVETLAMVDKVNIFSMSTLKMILDKEK